jgi:hypothetical protein
MKMRYAFLSLVLLVAIAFTAPPVYAQQDRDPAGLNGQLSFTSTPPLNAVVGVPYVYAARARSKDSTAVIRYRAEALRAPGFSIDSVTGRVTWTPVARGWFGLVIIARSNKGETAAQGFTVTVTGGYGIVQGKVIDTSGINIKNVAIEILQTNNIDLVSTGCYSFTAKTDSNGNYRIAGIEPGKYKLHATSPSTQYASQWYDGKPTASEATVITVSDSPAVTIANFTLRGGVVRNPAFTVSGTVKDTLSKAIKGADVFFVRAGFALNSNATVEDFRNMFDLEGDAVDFRLEGSSTHAFHATADSLGRYSIKLVTGIYIAYARATGYAVEFYLEQGSILTATEIPLTKDTSGINFTLAKLPAVVLGTIKGAVLDTVKGIGVRSRIIATRDRWTTRDSYSVSRSYMVDTDSLGVYTLPNLLPGLYFVMALPLGNYAPAFYTNDSVTTRWRKASRVVVAGTTVTGINIYVHPIPKATHGFTSIAGKIRVNGAAMSEAAGALVYAVRNGAVAGFAFANETGQYEIAGVAPGSYMVAADLIGYDSYDTKSASPTYNSSTGAPVSASSIDLNLSVTTDVAESSIEQPQSFALSQNYPNPFNPSTAISYQLASTSNVDLRVYDMLGREVAVLVTGVQNPGSYSVRFDATSLATGVYMYRLSAGAMTATMKMLLVK